MFESPQPPPPIPHSPSASPGPQFPTVTKSNNRGCLIALSVTAALGIIAIGSLIAFIMMVEAHHRSVAPSDLQRDPTLLPATVTLSRDISVVLPSGKTITASKGESVVVVSIKNTEATLRKNGTDFTVPLEATDGSDRILAAATAKHEEERKRREQQKRESAEAAEREQAEAEQRSAVWIQGRVISVVDDGLLVDNDMTHSVIFLKGRFDKVDGDKIWLNAIPIGTYKYKSVIGSHKTVHAFRPAQ